MTEQELLQIPFKCIGHLAMEHEHCMTYISEDGRLGFCDHTRVLEHGRFGRPRRHYRIDNKIYKSKKKFLDALKDFNPEHKIVPLWG